MNVHECHCCCAAVKNAEAVNAVMRSAAALRREAAVLERNAKSLAPKGWVQDIHGGWRDPIGVWSAEIAVKGNCHG